MSTFLEKITLYDLIGYTVPGFVFLLVVLYGLQDILDVLGKYKDTNGFFAVVILVVSYCVGIVLSELGRILDGILDCLLAFAGRYIHPSRGTARIFADMENIKRAMQNSKFWEGQDAPEVNSQAIRMMYSDIQTDDNFKRIHNYASAGVMYKNMFMSLFLGDSIILLRHGFGGVQYPYFNACFWTLLFLSVIFCVRWKRFDEKKDIYTINWFIKKYAK